MNDDQKEIGDHGSRVKVRKKITDHGSWGEEIKSRRSRINVFRIKNQRSRIKDHESKKTQFKDQKRISGSKNESKKRRSEKDQRSKKSTADQANQNFENTDSYSEIKEVRNQSVKHVHMCNTENSLTGKFSVSNPVPSRLKFRPMFSKKVNTFVILIEYWRWIDGWVANRAQNVHLFFQVL